MGQTHDDFAVNKHLLTATSIGFNWQF